METERSYSITSLSFLMLCVAIIIAAAMIRGGREAPDPDPYEHAVACCPCDLTINGDKRIFKGFMMRDTSCECPVLVVDLPEN